MEPLSGANMIPIGCVTIQETLAPEGYTINEEVYTVHFTLQPDGNVRADKGTWNTLNECEDLTVDSAEAPVRGDLKFVKRDSRTGRVLAGVAFKITGKTTKESHIMITDANGILDTSSSHVSHLANTNRGETAADGIWFGDAAKANDKEGALLYDTYTISEIAGDGNYGYDLIDEFEVTISEDAKTIDLGDVNDSPLTIRTKAWAADTESNIVPMGEAVVIMDTIDYDGLTAGRTYTFKGSVIDSSTGKVLTTGDVTITAETSKGTVDVEFKAINTKELSGKTLVITEILFEGTNERAKHDDLTDQAQTLFVPGIGTTAKDGQTGDHTGSIGTAVALVDTVSYKGLKVGEEYTLKGTLMDKATGKELLIDGQKVTAEKTFTPAATNGTVDITFTFNSVPLAGKTVVVFESLEYGETELAVHADIEDEEQSVYYSDIATTAADSATEDNQGAVSEKTTIVDTVSYTNLIVGNEYTVKGILMDKASGEALQENGKAITAERTFTAETASGNIEITFTLDYSILKGKTTVVFEDLYHENVLVAAHADITDEGQSVHYPDVKTTAADEDTQTHTGALKEEQTIIDTVIYTNLIPGNEYTVKGILMDQETGKALLVDGKEVTAETTFTAEEANGTAELRYVLDSTVLAGKTVVVFEDLYYLDVKAASHADIEDEEQSIHYPDVHTSAAADGKKNVVVSSKTTIVDRLSYTNLMPGEYKARGILMDKATGRPLLSNGKEVTAEKTFTVTEPDGFAELTFSFDSSALAGRTTVVFEEVYTAETDTEAEILVAEHKDITDKDQTVELKPVPPTPETGDTSRTGLYIGLMLAALAVISGLMFYRKRAG